MQISIKQQALLLAPLAAPLPLRVLAAPLPLPLPAVCCTLPFVQHFYQPTFTLIPQHANVLPTVSRADTRRDLFNWLSVPADAVCLCICVSVCLCVCAVCGRCGHRQFGICGVCVIFRSSFKQQIHIRCHIARQYELVALTVCVYVCSQFHFQTDPIRTPLPACHR